MTGIINPPMARTRSLVVAYESETVSASNLTTYTFTGESIGTEHPNRDVLVIVVSMFPIAGTGLTVSSVSVGGIAATYITGAGNIQTGDAGEGATRTRIEAWRIDASALAGTTATVSVTHSSSCYKCGVYVYSVEDGDYYSNNSATDSSTTAPDGLSLSLSTVVGGATVVVGVAFSSVAPTHSNTDLGSGVVDINNVVLEANVSGGTDVRIRNVTYQGATATSGTSNFNIADTSTRSLALAVHYRPTEER